MAYLEQLAQYFAEYDTAVQELQGSRRMFDGILGLGKHPGDAACHEILDKQISELCRQAAEEGTTPAERAEIVRAIFQAERKWQGPEYARLMLVAIQRHTPALISGMEAADRAEMAEWYNQTYPRRKRVPAQDQVLKALRA